MDSREVATRMFEYMSGPTAPSADECIDEIVEALVKAKREGMMEAVDMCSKSHSFEVRVFAAEKLRARAQEVK